MNVNANTAFQIGKYARVAGFGLGALGVTTTLMEGLADGSLSVGDWTKIGIGVLTVATPYGWVYGAADLATLAIFGKSATDHIGDYIDTF